MKDLELVRFPNLNKNNTLEENDKYMIESSYIEQVEIRKIITLNYEEYKKIADNLLKNCDLWERIGGRYIDDEIIENLESGSPEYYEAWREHGKTLVCKVINIDTCDCFYVNTEGYSYARYVGRPYHS